MKFKKTAAALSLSLASLMLLTACTGTPELAISANWYFNTTTVGLTDTYEKLTYAVTFEQEDPGASYRVSYDTGTYTSELVNESVTLSSGVRMGYHLHTELSVTGRYYMNGKAEDDFTDSVVSDVWFLGHTEGLHPVRSLKKVHCTAPNELSDSTGKASVVYDYTYEAVYNEALNETTITYTPTGEDEEQEVTTLSLGGDGTFLDNEQIIFAIRGLDMNGTSSASFRTVNPVKRQAANITVSAPTADRYVATFAVGLAGGDSVEELRTVDAASLTVSYDGNWSGQSQKIVYAKCTARDANTYRNVPLSFTVYSLSHQVSMLGTFTYQLKEAIFNQK